MTEFLDIDIDTIKATALSTYRCPRSCLLGYVSRVPRLGVVWSSRWRGKWTATTDPYEEPRFVECRHVKGLLPISDRALGTVTLAQEDVRTVEGKA